MQAANSTIQRTRATGVAFTFILIMLTACTPFQTRSELNDAKLRAARGGEQGRAVVAQVFANVATIPANLRPDALETILALPGREGDLAAIKAAGIPEFQAEQYQNSIRAKLMKSNEPEAVAFVMAQIKSNPDLLKTPTVVDWFIKRDPPGGAEMLFEIVKKNPELLSENIITYFGQKKYAPAIPMIINAAKENKFQAASMDALSSMKNPEANAAIMEMARSTGPLQVNAIARLGDIDDPSMKQEMDKMLEDKFRNSQPGEMRSAALASLSKVRGVEQPMLERDLLFDMAKVQGDLTEQKLPEKVQPQTVRTQPTQPTRIDPSTNRQLTIQGMLSNQKPITTQPLNQNQVNQKPVSTSSVEKPKESANKNVPPLNEVASNAYRQRIRGVFDDTFGDGGSAILKRIQDSLFTYAESNSPGSEFVIRSYRKKYGGDDAVARVLLSRGLKQPDCVAALVNNIKAEYPSKEMQVYALSKLFALKRWQSQVIVELSGEIQL